MNRIVSLVGIALVFAACSDSVDVDASESLPGSWLCDDGIVITFDRDGTYEWRVPSDGEITLHVEGSDQIRMNDDGGHSILDQWRVSDDVLEMDMLGETDRYKLEFRSDSEFQIAGPDTFTCRKR